MAVMPSGSAADSLVWQQHQGFRVAHVPVAEISNKVGFSEMSFAQTGLQFSNTLDDQAVLKNQNLMLGSGVAAGDFDGDGWCDLYFAAINGRNALYRNLGGWQFENVTEKAGVALANHASTGSVFADVNGDGRLDLLVSSLGRGVTLFINDGGGRFHDATDAVGLTSRAGSMTMTLGDVDGDGDLDLYVCNYGAQAVLKGGVDVRVKIVNGRHVIEGPQAERVRLENGRLIELGEPDALYLYDGAGKFQLAPWGTTRFLDEVGQPVAAPWDFGLSAQMRDVNADGAPDIYVCNDFDTPDRFWINDGRGNFRLIPRQAQCSQSYASMGVDFADIDRDGFLDFFVVEMLAANRARRLTQLNAQAPISPASRLNDQRPEVTRNTLFHARGDGTFEEIANYAGVSASDWSWQGSFLDVDLDGFEDLLVVNGHLFDVQNGDIAAPRSRKTEDMHAQLLASPRLFVPKKAWRNTGQLRFEDRSDAWRFNDTNLCHGMALADLDHDGDLDVVVNRMNAPAWLLRNDESAPRVMVRLSGTAPNTLGTGAKVTLRGGAVPVQTQEIISGGKYLSGDEAARVFAAGSSKAMTLEVTWRSGAHSTISNIEANCIYEIAETSVAKEISSSPKPVLPAPLFVDSSEKLKHVHAEAPFNDFQLQPTLAKKLSQRGPGLCVTDLDGDGREDLVIGAGRGGRLTFFRGDGRGGFTRAAQSEAVPDDVLAIVEWTAGDRVRGLLVSLANYESAKPEAPLLFVTLEKSELGFNVAIDPAALPQKRSAGGCVAVADVDGDGDLDVFLGGHAVTGRYPESAPSWLLRNESDGLHVDAVNSMLLQDVGLVNSAVWSDLDDDGWPELLLACEWGPVRVFKNERGQLKSWNAPVKFSDGKSSSLDSLSGWWSGLASADFDEDGRMDFVAGNWGLNTARCATFEQPLKIFYGDFLKRGTIDLLETEYDGDSREPMVGNSLSEVALHLPVIKQRFSSHGQWAASTAKNVLVGFSDVREGALSTLATTVFLNRGSHFEPVLLRGAQLSPVFSLLTADFNGDGHADIFLSQNCFAMRPDRAREDAGRGLLLLGNGHGEFTAAGDSGVSIYGDQRAAVTGDFDQDGRFDLVVAQNGDATRLYKNTGARAGIRVELSGSIANPKGIGARLQWGHGATSRHAWEIQSGSGWLSQNSAVAIVPLEAAGQSLRVRWPGGRETVTVIPPGASSIRVEESGNISGR